MGDLGVMVTDLEKKTVKVWLKFLEAKGDSGKLHYPITALIIY